MSISDQEITSNRILSKLPLSDCRLLEPSLKHVQLAAKDVLFSPGDTVKYLYFPNNAVVSLMFAIDGQLPVEVAMEGNEGAVGWAASLGEMQSSTLSVVRDAGSAMRLDAKILRRPERANQHLKRLLNRYLHGLITQIAQAGMCNRFHSIEARLARWLLMSQDRVGSPNLLATQKSIAQMLGVRRSSITDAAHDLLKQKTINYSRGHIEIVNRRGLTARACSCYDIINHHYDFLPR